MLPITSHPLFILIVLNTLLLIGFLLRTARQSRRTAAQAQAVERFNALFAAALQSTRVGVFIRDVQKSDQPIVFINEAFTSMTGYTSQDLIGKDITFLFGSFTDSVRVLDYKQGIKDQKSLTLDLLTYRKNGSNFWSEWHLSPIAHKGKTVTHYATLLTDISLIRQTSEALQLAKEEAERASSAKANFLAMMSHEIRTPINGMLGVLDLLKDTPMNTKQKELVSIALSSGNALHEIVNDVLDYSKIEAGKMAMAISPFSLRTLLKETLLLVQPNVDAKNLELKLELDETIPDTLMSDQGRLRQILLNLLTNAIKFTHRGSVTLRLQTMFASTDNNQTEILLRFEVIDTGIGISQDNQTKLFKKFSQVEQSFARSYGGTGLGLIISQQLVILLNGEIGFESKPDMGSKFWVILPMQVAGSSALTETQGIAPSMPHAASALIKNKNILLVEDNLTNQIVARSYLEKAGCSPDVASNGNEALDKTALHPYDLILMDVSMPDIDGLEVTRRIRARGGRHTQTPIIALTAHNAHSDHEACLAAGMDDYASKPLQYPLFITLLERWLQPHKPSLEHAKVVEAHSVKEEKVIPLLDIRSLQNIADDLGTKIALQIIDVFLKDMQMRVTVMQEADLAKDSDIIALHAHTLKSSSANCGLMQFSALMAGIEKAINAADLTEARLLIQKIASACASSIAELGVIKSKWCSPTALAGGAGGGSVSDD